MLEKSLDVLRNKELNFGCIVFDGEECMRYTNSDDFRGFIHGIFEDGESGGLENDGEYEILGHPLTRGRLYHLYVTLNISNGGDFKEFIEPPKGNIDTFREIDKIIFYYGYDSSEIERMQNTELWNKLYPLLVEFAGYF